MNGGMYSALSGNLSAMERLDVIANNLANVNTAGFKKDRLAFESVLAGNLNPPAVPPGQTADPVLLKARMVTDQSPGALVQTGNQLDVALQGDGFFVVRTPDGGTAYTRQGSFRLAADGTLVTASGYPLLSREERQPIKLDVADQPGGGKPVIDNQGNITLNGAAAGSLAIVDFPKPYQLAKEGDTLFVPAPGSGAVPQDSGPTTTVVQGSLEQSNVDAVAEMVQMVEANRFFETCQRVVRNFSDIASKAANDLGKV